MVSRRIDMVFPVLGTKMRLTNLSPEPSEVNSIIQPSSKGLLLALVNRKLGAAEKRPLLPLTIAVTGFGRPTRSTEG